MNNDATPYTAKPIPTLAEWLGDGTRADGFEAWVRETIFIESNLTNEEEAASLRMIRTMVIATMEVCRTESEQHHRDNARTTVLLARATGAAVMGAILSQLKEGRKGGMPRLCRVLAEEFKVGAKLMADGAVRRGQA